MQLHPPITTARCCHTVHKLFLRCMVSIQCASVYLKQPLTNNDFHGKWAINALLTLETGALETCSGCFGRSLRRSVQPELHLVHTSAKQTKQKSPNWEKKKKKVDTDC
ncbi:Hypothetical protein SMAX5B_018322 [Scophthalmus maximus]|uniref:Uncharacterized protein n=1 Tax=Scophthalmus maximus TaxID=52904 RepID=A0A2U9C8M3_SCOMX|nr:Hypothetical protein SMAX5B_018322 [Scophthalmus maximus]KAF0026286.1 hypothetical protein F2P81_021023 [Scophthalmus maximus]